MSEMVERAARAINRARYTEWDVDDSDRDMARAAIEAMREPTEAMLNAVDVPGGESTYPLELGSLLMAWDQMIDEALK